MSSGNPETRKKILNATWDLLEDSGGNEVRMSDIAKKAGVSRQALYLHFPKRADLLIATTLLIDAVKDVDGRLRASRSAATGTERLDAFIEAWGNYIPEIYGPGKAMLAMAETDEDARLAWAGRMDAVRQGCRAAVEALERDCDLNSTHTVQQATDILCVMLSLRAWEQFTREFGWSQAAYIEKTRVIARQVLVAAPAERRAQGVLRST